MPTKIHNGDQINTGLRAILERPVVYLIFQRIMGCHIKYTMYVNEFLKPTRGMKILDIGCGCAEILKYLPQEVDYVGYDVSTRYIEYAQKKYAHRARFYNQRVTEINIPDKGSFDVVLADGLLHHLRDSEAKDLFTVGISALNDTGFMFTADPAFIEDQGIIARLISSMDRGRHVRYPEDYKQIADACFSRVETHVVHNVGNRPQTGCFLKCYK